MFCPLVVKVIYYGWQTFMINELVSFQKLVAGNLLEETFWSLVCFPQLYVAPRSPASSVSAWISSWQEWKRASQGHLSALSKMYRIQQDPPYVKASPPEPVSVVIFTFAWPVLTTFLLTVTRSYHFLIVLGTVFVPAASPIAFLKIFPLFCLKPCFEAVFWSCDQDFFWFYCFFYFFFLL